MSIVPLLMGIIKVYVPHECIIILLLLLKPPISLSLLLFILSSRFPLGFSELILAYATSPTVRYSCNISPSLGFDDRRMVTWGTVSNFATLYNARPSSRNLCSVLGRCKIDDICLQTWSKAIQCHHSSCQFFFNFFNVLWWLNSSDSSYLVRTGFDSSICYYVTEELNYRLTQMNN